MQRPFKFSLNWVQAAFIVIVLATLFNGFVASLSYQYAPQIDTTSEATQQRFLGYPGDLHADVIAVALSLPPFVPIDGANWPYPYRKFLLQNHYHSWDFSHGTPVDVTTWSPPPSPPRLNESWDLVNPDPNYSGHRPDLVMTCLHITPLIMFISLLMKRLIIAHGPLLVVAVHYVITFAGLASACLVMLPDWKRRTASFLAIAFSYPFIHILLRGNQGSAFAGFALIIFVYLVCRTNRVVLAALLLAFACNVRPNAIALAPLLLCFGLRPALLGGAVFSAVGGLLFFAAFKGDQLLYPGYQLQYFRGALDRYYQNYLISAWGNSGNNSLFGAVKLTYLFVARTQGPLHAHLLDVLNKAFAFVFTLVELVVCALYLRGKWTHLAFSFFLVAIYMLASSVFASYHLIIFAVFPLLLANSPNPALSRSELAILFGSVFVLIPKCYYFYHGVTPDAVLNPLVLLAAACYIAYEQLAPGQHELPSREIRTESANQLCRSFIVPTESQG